MVLQDKDRRNWHTFDLGLAADGASPRKVAILLKTNAYSDLKGLFQMTARKDDSNTTEDFDKMKISEALAEAVVVPFRITYSKNNRDSQSAVIYVPRDRIEEALDKDNGVTKKKYNGFKITNIRPVLRRHVSAI